MARKSLSDILRNGDRENLSRAWGETKAAEDFRRCRRANTSPGYRGELFNEQDEGHAGRINSPSE